MGQQNNGGVNTVNLVLIVGYFFIQLGNFFIQLLDVIFNNIAESVILLLTSSILLQNIINGLELEGLIVVCCCGPQFARLLSPVLLLDLVTDLWQGLGPGVNKCEGEVFGQLELFLKPYMLLMFNNAILGSFLPLVLLSR